MRSSARIEGMKTGEPAAKKPAAARSPSSDFEAAIERLAATLADKPAAPSQAQSDASQRATRRRSGWLDLSKPQDDTPANHRMARLISQLGLARVERVKVSTSEPAKGFVEYEKGKKVR